ncbi:MAG: hypothetical protein Phyf2KO_10580 [Phycisphaerales bacterium]
MVEAPTAFGPVPTSSQLAWHELEFYAFVHFTTNTFTDREWGYGDESPEVFQPSAFDADQIVGVLADAGARAVILTCKHHDGFCLWDSAHTEHDVASSDWLDGEGDVVRAFAEACRSRNIRFGVYLSPWDRNHPAYGEPEYVEYFRAQLSELLTRYGPICEVWFDGANGGDGYYGGARETRHIDRTSYYGWEETFALVRELQPNAVIFSDVGPDVRWVGNEAGFAGDPCWATYNPMPLKGGATAAPGATQYREAEHGHRDGTHWMPAEADVSIRPGWFYHESENDSVRSPENLFELYMKSVGRGASLLLNVPPDRRGMIHEADEASLREFGELLKGTFGIDLAEGATAFASNSRGRSQMFDPENSIDSDQTSYWATEDEIREAWLEIRLPEVQTFNIVSLREYLPLGQRIDEWAIDVWEGEGWIELSSGTSIGARRLVWSEPVTTDRIRLRIIEAAACPALSEFSLHLGPMIGVE